jgi:hypothetical protein
MTKKKYEEKLHIDMDPDEALERFINVDPQELQANLDKQKRKKRPPDNRTEGKADGPSQSVINLRDRRKRKHVG